MAKKIRPNIHPGEILQAGFLLPTHTSQNALALARAACLPPRRINEIVLGKRGVTAETAPRLRKVFGTGEKFWLGLQAEYDLEESRNIIDADLDRIERGSLTFAEKSTTAPFALP